MKMKLYSRLKIQKKFMLILLLEAVMMIVINAVSISFLSMQHTNMTLDLTSEVLQLYSNVVESRIDSIQKVSFLMLSDFSIQNDAQLLYSEADYVRHSAATRLKESLLSYSFMEEMIVSITFFKTNGEQLTSGRAIQYYSSEEAEEIVKRCAQKEGDYLWLTDLGNPECVQLAREYRSTRNPIFKPVGTLVISLERKMLFNTSKMSTPMKSMSNMIVLSAENRVIHGGEGIFSPKSLEKLNDDASPGYRVISLNGTPYFATFTPSSETDWRYVNLIPYHVITEHQRLIQYIAILVSLVGFLGITMINKRFADGMTRPIIALSDATKEVCKENFDIPEMKELTQGKEDELSRLCSDFDIMVKRLKALIEENYTKQILIQDLRYRMLQAQINPHFLYNTLDTINWMAKKGKEPRISIMIKALGNLFKAATAKQSLITIREELQLVSDYIDIQQIRFGNRLEFQIEFDEACMECLIPKFTLQPLAENAVKYALERTGQACRIAVAVFQEGCTISATICDNGPGMDPSLAQAILHGKIQAQPNSIGIYNIQERLRMKFGEQFNLQINSVLGKGTSITISFPYELPNEEEQGESKHV